MSGIKYLLLFFVALNIYSVNGYSYSLLPASNPLNENVNTFQAQEKVFVQLDNTIYIPGDKMYYTAWLVNADSNIPESFNSILYFELLSHSGKRCMFWRTNISNGNASGSITIPDSLHGGVYTFRAFTNRMRNNDAAFYFATNILITRLNDTELKSISVPVPYNSVPGSVEFYPEGGHLVANLECRVGVKANLIPPAKVLTGFVKNINDSLVASFRTDSYGLAVFSFKPEKNNSYKVYISNEEGKTNEYILPAINSDGFSVQLTQNTGNISLKILSVQESDSENGPFSINVSLRGKTVYDTLLRFKNGVTDIFIGNKKTASGINDLKIRNRHNEIVYENFFYIDGDTPQIINTISVNPTYQPGEKINLLLEPVSQQHQDSLQLSVTVANTNPFPFIGSNKSIKQYLNFFSEIAGSYCFQNFNESFSVDRANKFLLCLKPSDYFWNIMHDDQTHCFYLPETKGYVFSGTLSDKESGKPVCNQNICLSVVDSIPSFNYEVTDSTGAFHFLLDKSFDNKNLVLQLINPPLKSTSYAWETDNRNDLEFNHPSEKYNFTKTDLAYLDNFRKIKLVNAIYNGNEKSANRTILIQDKRQYQNFEIIPDNSVFPGDYIDLDTFEDITNNILSGVKVKKDEFSSSIFIFDPENKAEMPYPATLFLNGVPMYENDYIINLKAKAISRIDLNQSLVMYGNYTFNGIVSITTKDRKFPADDFNNKRKHIQNEVEPDMPALKYEESEVACNRKETLPDLRYLLYINQLLKINGRESAAIGITVSNLKESYSISIQGITNKGQLISELLKFNVK